MSHLFYFFLSPSFLILFGPPCAIVFWLWRRNSAHHQVCTYNAAPASRAGVNAEVLAITGLSFSLLVMLATYRQYDGLPEALRETASDAARAGFWRTVSIWAAIIGVAIVLAWFRKVKLAVGLLVLFFSIAGFCVNEGWAFSRDDQDQHLRDTTVPMLVTVNSGIVGADVYFNGFHIGKTPLEVDYDQTLAAVPDWNNRNDVPEELLDLSRSIYGEFGTLKPAARLHLQPATKVTFDDENPDSRDIYATVELNGQPMMAWLHQDSVRSGSRFPSVKPATVELDMVMPRWLDEVESLINRARLSDYQVNQEWTEAIQSYGHLGWRRIQQLAGTEPELNQVLDAWAANAHDITSPLTSEAAWTVFERLQAAADEEGSYHTSSTAGQALQQLVPHLNAYRLVKLAEDRINSFRRQPSVSWGHEFKNGQWHFGNYETLSNGQFKASDMVTVHAVHELDRLLDEQDDATDNLVEERITPALLRITQRRGNTFNAAAALGGSVYERFILRHDWRTEATEDTPYTDRILGAGLTVNRWLFAAANLDSPAGRAFRRENVSRLEELAERIVVQSGEFDSTWRSTKLNFLFLDNAEPSSPLPVRFWRTFNHLAASEKHNASQAPLVRWEYLRRLGQHATVQQFVDAYRPYCDEKCGKYPLEALPPGLQFRVLDALVVESQELVRDTKKYSRPNRIRDANLQDFEAMRRLVPCEESAELFVAWMQEKDRSVGHLIKSNKLSPHHVAAMARQPDLRELALDAVKHRPTPKHCVAVLQATESATDTDTDTGANEAKAQFKEWMASQLAQPLPHRGN